MIPLMRNVLIIGSRTEDLAVALTGDGFEVTVRAPGEAVLDELSDVNVAVLLMAEAAEDPVAKRLLEGVQSGQSPPLIAVIPRPDVDTFDPTGGVDDFFVEGNDPAELTARVRQALWKRHQVDARNVLKIGNLVMDLANYTVHVNGAPVDLTYKEYELLRFLATNPDRVFDREQLLNKVWGYDFYGGARTVDVHIRRLRAKIEDRHTTFIETVRNVGYRFRARA